MEFSISPRSVITWRLCACLTILFSCKCMTLNGPYFSASVTCADPECFAREGSSLATFYFDDVRDSK